MFNKKTIEDIDVSNKKVLVRVDYNVPLDSDLNVTDNSRIRLSLPTINYLLERNAKVILMSHLGRPKGEIVEKYRLTPAAKELEKLTGKPVKKFDEIVSPEIKDYIDNKMKYGEIVMLENVRFNPGETKNNIDFAKELASLADIYVDDAFGASHRAHSSTVGVTQFLPSVAGFLLKKEVEVLTSILEAPDKPFLAVLGGAKVADKIMVIQNFITRVNSLIVGGGMSYTFLKSKGYEIGKSIHAEDPAEYESQIKFAKESIEAAAKNNVNFITPIDVVVGKTDEQGNIIDKKTVSADSIPADYEGFDMGEKTLALYESEIAKAKTIFWNGPVGFFENKEFENGTRRVATAIANSNAKTVAGGGDTLAALKKFGLTDKFFHVSSGGGASMELLEGKELPGVAALLDK
ncbi:MAG: phosphoglycerate kinase [Actinobacteria bacterium]|nr:phosphoglycerate kinase [Actinomycetota bacterium]